MAFHVDGPVLFFPGQGRFRSQLTLFATRAQDDLPRDCPFQVCVATRGRIHRQSMALGAVDCNRDWPRQRKGEIMQRGDLNLLRLIYI